MSDVNTREIDTSPTEKEPGKDADEASDRADDDPTNEQP